MLFFESFLKDKLFEVIKIKTFDELSITTNVKMLSKTLDVIKPILGAVLIVVVLQAAGILGRVEYVTHSAALKAGLLDVKVTQPTASEEDFDYNFAIKDLKGTKITLDQFKGKVIFLNLWATWCGPCRAEMPTIQKLYDDLAKDNIVFVMLSLDKDQDKEKIVAYIQHKAFTFPVYQPSGYLTEQLNIPSIPT